MSVPDHLIEKAAEILFTAAGWDDWGVALDGEKAEFANLARPVLNAVADELRAEGARAERERIAGEIETLRFPWRRAADHVRAMPDAERVREGGDTDAA